jgi:hypothetical protein
VAIGYAVNYPDEEKARAKALGTCTGYDKAAQEAKEKCEVVKVFVDECLAVAMDPEPGTSGFGWAVRTSLEAAKGEAMAKCTETATRTRERKCEIVARSCDGKLF